ncbi:hypothetical protein L0244_39235, partial [bacterium]|nr:hypothetical protein [bacterium]
PATGSIALPNDSSLMRGIAPLPVEFRNLCKWAPRTPTEGVKSPYNAIELFEVSKNWDDAVRNQKPYRPPRKSRQAYKWTGLVWTALLLFLAALFAVLGFPGLSGLFPNASATSMLTLTELTPLVSSEAPTLTETQTAIVTFTATPTLQAELTSTASAAPIPVISPAPNTLTAPIKVFDNKIIVDLENPCWHDETSLLDGLRDEEGFDRRPNADRYWKFRIEKDRLPDDIVQTDFMPCIANEVKPIRAIGMDVSIQSLESGREFGFFLEDQNGQRREYTLWLEDARLYLRIRQDNNMTDYEQLILNNLKVNRVSHLHTYYQFSLQIFFEINNQGLDILYLREGRLQIPAKVEDVDPSNGMKRIDEAVLPTLTNIEKIGLIGYGGDTQVAIWPLVFFGK